MPTITAITLPTAADADPDRAARGKPVAFKDGVPVYDSGRAPAFLAANADLAPGDPKRWLIRY
ncbi:hypothetical protein [Streptomyces aurantiogriseus]|uniref:Uncharacterized protein n=1 Tax=Streptomyces aurantiogriseus TaxID=66870 RepID=A0A918FPN4_9ACTN|nr:hypothetical protein [Streptomyces aurantiogriseus]GGR65260.1 hypothetical protein GCM10010251_97210 [Streptomyces aurantiogriseus]